MNDMVPWIGIAISLATLAYTILSSRSKANFSRVREIERKLNDKADGVSQAALAGKVDIVEDRVTRVETDMKHLPGKDIAHKLEVSLTELSGRVEMLTERLVPVTAMASRIQEALIERVAK